MAQGKPMIASAASGGHSFGAAVELPAAWPAPAEDQVLGRSDGTSLSLREMSARSMAAQTLMIALPLVTTWPDLIFGGLPKTTVHCQPRPSSSTVYWTPRYSIDRPVAFRRRSEPQSLAALPAAARPAVMAYGWTIEKANF
jgi:hypothetical protein